MNFSKYQNRLSYPHRPSAPKSLGPKPSYDQALEYAEAVKEYEEKEKEYQKLASDYQAEDNKLYNQFRADAIVEVGLFGHPKADKVFVKAWERGHSSGYEEVFNALEDLAELVL